MPKTLFARSPKPEAAAPPADAALAGAQADAAAADESYRAAKQKLELAQTTVAELHGRYDVACSTVAEGREPDETPEHLRQALAAAEDAAHGCTIVAAEAQRRADAAGRALADAQAAEQQRQRAARIRSLSDDYRAQAARAQEQLAAGVAATRAADAALVELGSLDWAGANRLRAEAGAIELVEVVAIGQHRVRVTVTLSESAVAQPAARRA